MGPLELKVANALVFLSNHILVEKLAIAVKSKTDVWAK